MLQNVKDCVSHLTTTLVGMKVTLREFVDPGRTCTVQYPDERRELPPRFRGMLVNDVTRCIGCLACAKVCPVDCFTIEPEGKGRQRHAKRFVINFYRCCWCALCTEVCPTDSLYMSQDYETVYDSRAQMIRDFCQDPIPPGPSARELAEPKATVKKAAVKKTPVKKTVPEKAVPEKAEAKDDIATTTKTATVTQTAADTATTAKTATVAQTADTQAARKTENQAGETPGANDTEQG